MIDFTSNYRQCRKRCSMGKSALIGKNPMEKAESYAVVSLLDLGKDVEYALQLIF